MGDSEGDDRIGVEVSKRLADRLKSSVPFVQVVNDICSVVHDYGRRLEQEHQPAVDRKTEVGVSWNEIAAITCAQIWLDDGDFYFGGNGSILCGVEDIVLPIGFPSSYRHTNPSVADDAVLDCWAI